MSLGLAMCAERIALFATVVLVSPRTAGHLTFRCGAYLQVALELGGPDLRVVACDLRGASETTRLGDLAPRLPHKATRAGGSRR